MGWQNQRNFIIDLEGKKPNKANALGRQKAPLVPRYAFRRR